MAKYRKKPIIVEAEQWFKHDDSFWVEQLPEQQSSWCHHCSASLDLHGVIKTLEGTLCVCPGDWIITGVIGEKYPIKDEIFRETYEPADD